MKLPKRKKILGSIWKIKYQKQIEYNGVYVAGLCIYTEKTILVTIDQDSAETRRTLYHELGHALLFELGMRQTSLTPDIEELIVEGFSRFLEQHFRLKY